jgi:energy-coupling factor transport system substrate-specific component
MYAGRNEPAYFLRMVGTVPYGSAQTQRQKPSPMLETGTDSMSGTQQRSFADRIRADFTTEAWVLIPIGVGINIVVGSIVQTLRLPLFLDTMGTMLVALLAGPWVAAIAGVLTNVVLGFTVGPQLIPFALVNVAIALTIGYLAQRGWFRIRSTTGYWRLVAAGAILGVVNTLVSTPVAVLLFGGLTGSGQDIITTVFLAAGLPIWSAVFVSSLLVGGIIDKTASIVIAYFVAKSVPGRYLPARGREALEA